MSRKRALIVDDSKSARVVLGRMLQKYDIEVDTAESAEVAIDYLKQNRPDVIFMDHLMPGMDGFQAVQAIKNNPQTATIPIMMYTSQQGELYVGQARALGAIGVLPKLVKPVDVSKVLYQLHLLPDRRDSTPPAFINANPSVTAPAARESREVDSPVPAEPQAPAPSPLPADWHAQLESAFRNHDAELRRFVVANLDSFADRVSSDLRNYLNEMPGLHDKASAKAPRPYVWILALLLALAPTVVLGVFYVNATDTNRQLSAQLAQLEQSNAQLRARSGRPAENSAPISDPADGGPGKAAAAEDSLQPTVEPVPYGEVPLSLARVDTLRTWLTRLRERDFKGQLRVQTFTGQFCLKGNSVDGYVPAPDDLPAAQCDLIGNPHEEALSPAQHESLAFANLSSSARQGGEESFTVDVALNGERTAAPYPSRDSATAAEWNAAAARNNRVEFEAIPVPLAVPSAVPSALPPGR